MKPYTVTVEREYVFEAANDERAIEHAGRLVAAIDSHGHAPRYTASEVRRGEQGKILMQEIHEEKR